MTDIFFSYSSKDRDAVRPVRDALAGLGFDVFWDQSVPPGVDWDTWIRGHLNRSKCALVFWSPNAVESPNVRHEAMVAKQQGKLVPALLQTLTAEQFPMGLYTDQAANLADWTGDERHGEWLKLQGAVEEKLKPHAPLWLQRTIHDLDADLLSERTRLRSTEHRVRALQDRIAQSAIANQDRERERDTAVDELAILKARLTEAGQARATLSAKVEELTRHLGHAESTGRTAAERLATAEASNADAKAARIGAESLVARLTEDVRRLEAEKVEAAAHHAGLEAKFRDPATAQPSSRGHIGWLDLIVLAGLATWLLMFATGTTWPSGIPTGARDYVGYAGVAALVWAIVVVLRMFRRRRIRPGAGGPGAKSSVSLGASSPGRTTVLLAASAAVCGLLAYPTICVAMLGFSLTSRTVINGSVLAPMLAALAVLAHRKYFQSAPPIALVMGYGVAAAGLSLPVLRLLAL